MSDFEWVIPPGEQLVPNTEEYGRRVLVAVQAVANYWGQSIQDAARQNANWENRTGNARSGLFYAVEGFGLGVIIGEISPAAKSQMSDVSIETAGDDTLIIALSHTVFYGRFLELSNGGQYAIIMTTIESHLPALNKMVQEIFKG